MLNKRTGTLIFLAWISSLYLCTGLLQTVRLLIFSQANYVIFATSNYWIFLWHVILLIVAYAAMLHALWQRWSRHMLSLHNCVLVLIATFAIFRNPLQWHHPACWRGGQILKFKNITKIIFIIALLKKNSGILNIGKSPKIRNSRKVKHMEITRSTVLLRQRWLRTDSKTNTAVSCVRWWGAE